MFFRRKKDLRIIFLFLKPNQSNKVCFLECIDIYNLKNEKLFKKIKIPIDMDVTFDSSMIKSFEKILNDIMKNDFVVKKEFKNSIILNSFITIIKKYKKKYKDINGVILDSV